MKNNEDETTSKCIRTSNPEGPQAFIRIICSNADQHLFPYGHLLSVKFAQIENKDVIHLFFAAHDVAIAGERLDELLLQLRRTHVTSIIRQDTPPQPDGPWVHEIEVQVRQMDAV